MEDFDPFASSASPSFAKANPCLLQLNDGDASAAPCGVLAPEMMGLSLGGGGSGSRENSPFSLVGGGIIGAADADSAGSSSSGKEGSPFGSNGFPEAKAFNALVQQQVSPDDEDADAVGSNGSVLSPTAPEFTPPLSTGFGGKATSPLLSPDAAVFVPSTIPEEDAAAIVDSWGPPLGLPPAKPKVTPAPPGGARPKSGATAPARPGTTSSRRAPSPASSTTSTGPAGRKAPGGAATAQKGRATSGGAKASPPPPALVPFYFDVAYVPAQGRPDALGKFFSRVRAKHYMLSCVDPPASTLDALLDAKVRTKLVEGSVVAQRLLKF